MCGCAKVTYTQYRSDEIFQGKGGSVKTVDDIDFWEYGKPNQKYKIIGVIDYSANDAPIQNSTKDSKIAAKCKEYNCDGVILVVEDRTFSGTAYQPIGNAVAGRAIHKKILKYEVIKYID